MRALVIHHPGNISIQQMPEPELMKGWALIRPTLVGICGSDIHAYTGHQPFAKYPVIPGHEIVGRVEAVSEEMRDTIPLGRSVPATLEIGSRVVVDPAVPCGKCCACKRGRYNACVNQQVIGVHIHGGAAELVAVPKDSCVPVPDAISDEAAAVIEPLSIGLQACRRGRVNVGEYVVIVGGGPIGLCVLLQAQAIRAKCAVVEPEPARRAKAHELGAEVVVSPEQAQEAIAQWAPDACPDVVVEAAGTPTTLRQAIDLAGAAGRVVVLGFWPSDISIEGPSIVRKELEIIGSRLHCGTVQETVAQVAAGLIDPTVLISMIKELDEGAQVFEALARDKSTFKVLLKV